MAIVMEIRQNEYHQGEVSIPQLAKLENLSYGSMDPEFCMVFDAVGDRYTVFYDENSIGRGFEVCFKGSNVAINLPIPNTATDIRNAYRVVKRVCDIFNVDNFICDGEIVTVQHIPQLVESNIAISCEAIEKIDRHVRKGAHNSITILAAMNPIVVGEAQLDEIDGTIEGFEKFLHRMQQMNVFYATPKYYKLDDGTVFGLYFITENVMAVIPSEPYPPFAKIENLKGYYVRIPDGNEVPYKDFLENAMYMGPYDANHVVVCLTEKNIAYMAENCCVAIANGTAEDKKVKGVYWGRMIDNGRTHMSKVKRMQLDTQELNGLNHLAVFLRWAAGKDLLSERLMAQVPGIKELCSDPQTDLRHLIAENPAFNYCLRGDHFNKAGMYFIRDFYRFNTGKGFPACVDEFVEKTMGSEKYHCEEYKNEAYLFMQYDEKYYKGLSKYLDREWKKYK